jgi:hypothetical protein
MKLKHVFAISLVLVIIVPVFLYYGFLAYTTVKGEPSDLFVGIDVAYDNVTEIKRFAVEIRPYTNTIVFGSAGITLDIEKLDDLCQYVYDRDFYFMIYAHPANDVAFVAVQRQWVLIARSRWGEKFLGLYAFDEPGGTQLDDADMKVVPDADWFAENWTEAADKFVNLASLKLHHVIEDQMGGLDLPLFASDYVLYWFDYKVGYDVVFAEFGWNYSRHINVALDRGAANVRNKEWGVMITWTYTQPPYLESGKELYDDLVLAYENGAKYILVFDANENYIQSTLQPEHLDALKKFWRYATDNPRPNNPPIKRVAYVLPKDYAYGFRGPNDTVWGIWEADDFSYQIRIEVGHLLDRYQNRLDIIYDDGLEANNTYGYGEFTFWNGTVLIP